MLFRLFIGVLTSKYNKISSLMPYTSIDMVSLNTISSLIPNPNCKSAIYLNEKYNYNTDNKKMELEYIDIKTGNTTKIYTFKEYKASNFIWFDEIWTENIIFLKILIVYNNFVFMYMYLCI